MHPMSLLASWALVWLSLGATMAWAQQVREGPAHRAACSSHAKLVEILKRTYAEAPSALGLQANGDLLELFVSRKSASWTIVSTRPDGVSCIVAAGRHWQELSAPPAEPAV